MTSKKIAWIGAGKMGLPICKRLKVAGHDVRVLARKPEQASALQSLGFTTHNSIGQVVSGADIVFTAVTDDQALSSVVINNDFVSALSLQAIYIDMSTVSPEVSAKIAAQLPKNISYLRSPVSGSTAMAEAGTLTALVSGPKSSFDALADVFAVFSKKAFHLGEAEEARYLKLAINSMVAATSALLGEALAFGGKGGLSNSAMLEVINQSAVASPLIGYKTDMITKNDYRPAASLNMLKKDLDLLLKAAKTLGVSLPVNSGIKTLYDAAAANGLGEKDFFVLVQEAEKAANTAVP